ncbi:pirin family protein [Sphingobacteriaceae bacterium WQ 2009]|uniref:Pirin family protein n=1 Tax=Rhinopithecimicrobium faecis TaxID=2820698 RepID=A0A8T4H4Y3_9SPHI|nr:pirin family protein [Sphingobacteriaceae bacterium WQ 2009]
MQKIIQRAEERGIADFGWLKSAHSFSFGQYYNPQSMNFGALRVLNDDHVAAGRGFGEHPHDNMEIVSIPLSGSLQHSDSMGNAGVIQAGEVQIMSAGTGVAHAEMNASKTDAVDFLQIWVFPKERDITPSYAQKYYTDLDRTDKLACIVSPDKADEKAVFINQDAWFNIGNLSAGTALDYTLHGPGQGVYIFVLAGSVEVGDEILHKRDAIGISATEMVTLKALIPAEVLVIEVPMS